MQLEILIKEALLSIINDRNSSQEARELALDTLAELAAHPSFFPELYVNYDCDLYGSPLCDQVLKVLKKNALPQPGFEYEASHCAVLRAMVSAVHGMALRSRISPKPLDQGHTTPDLAAMRQEKEAMEAAAALFNAKPKKSIEKISLLEPLDAKKVAEFFRKNPYLDKKAIGEFLGLQTDFAKEVLNMLMCSFDFSGWTFDHALRRLLLSFRLPGEAQQIDTIMETFAAHYCKSNPDAFTCADTAYTLAFSTMMLNTDLHNESVRKKMTTAAWLKNNRGIDKTVDGVERDLPEALLLEVYQSILENEIRMSDDVANEDMDYIQWETAEEDASRTSGYLPIEDTGCDHHLFDLISGSMMPALSSVMENSGDEQVLALACEGYKLCVEVAAGMEMPRVIDRVVVSLVRGTEQIAKTNRPLSYLAKTYQAQLAIKSLFSITRDYGNYLKEGWGGVVEVVLLLHRLDLLPDSLTLITEESHAHSLKRVPSPSHTRNPKRTSSMNSLRSLLWADAEEEEAQHPEMDLTLTLTLTLTLIGGATS